MFERYNEDARRVLFFSRYEAAQSGVLGIEPEHLILGVLRNAPECIVRFAAADRTAESLRAPLEAAARGGERTSTSVEIPFSRESKHALQGAAAEADALMNETIRPEHLVLGVLLQTTSEASRVLHAAGVDVADIRDFLKSATDESVSARATLHAAAGQGAAIVRQWTGVVTRGREEAYIMHLRRETIPALRRLRGFLTASIMSREVEDGTEFQVVTLWSSRQAIEAFAGRDIDVAVVPPDAQALLVRYDARVVHYEIVQ
jgi:ATP-dependent Clp protease ATP-binding subunit ClpA